MLSSAPDACCAASRRNCFAFFARMTHLACETSPPSISINAAAARREGTARWNLHWRQAMSAQQQTGNVSERRIVAHNDATDSENKIHDDAEARRLGLRGGLVPGVTLYAYLTPLLVDVFGSEWLQEGGATIRFLRPVYEGETITCRLAQTADGAEISVLGPDG